MTLTSCLVADHDVLVIGAGFSGIGAGIKLREAGFHDFAILEQADDLGGTWRDNTYPGIAVDITSFTYSFSFAQNPSWSRVFAPGSETGKGWHDTSAKPELFANGAKFAELGTEFGKESNELVRVVSSGADAAAVKDQFGKVQRTCKSCHDEFRNAN